MNPRLRSGFCYISPLIKISIPVCSERLCFTFCLLLSKAKHLTASNLVKVLNCSLQSHRTYPVEVWKLFFRKASPALDQALVKFATMVNTIPQFHISGISPWEFCVKPKWFVQFQAQNNSYPSSSYALEALGELRIANFSQAQLQNNTFVSKWFHTKIRPFLASPSKNFLFCLSSKNLSCHTYQTV